MKPKKLAFLETLTITAGPLVLSHRSVASGFVSLDLSSNGQDASATARVRIPLGGAE